MKTNVNPQAPDVIEQRLKEKDAQRESDFDTRIQSPRKFLRRGTAITLHRCGFSEKTKLI